MIILTSTSSKQQVVIRNMEAMRQSQTSMIINVDIVFASHDLESAEVI